MTMDHEARAGVRKLEGQVADLLKRVLALEARVWPDPDEADFTDPEDISYQLDRIERDGES